MLRIRCHRPELFSRGVCGDAKAVGLTTLEHVSVLVLLCAQVHLASSGSVCLHLAGRCDCLVKPGRPFVDVRTFLIDLSQWEIEQAVPSGVFPKGLGVGMFHRVCAGQEFANVRAFSQELSHPRVRVEWLAVFDAECREESHVRLVLWQDRFALNRPVDCLEIVETRRGLAGPWLINTHDELDRLRLTAERIDH